jgi:hypothetical protein
VEINLTKTASLSVSITEENLCGRLDTADRRVGQLSYSEARASADAGRPSGKPLSGLFSARQSLRRCSSGSFGIRPA